MCKHAILLGLVPLSFTALAGVLGTLLAPDGDDWRRRALGRRMRQQEVDVVAGFVEVFFLLVTVAWCGRPDTYLNQNAERDKRTTAQGWANC